MTRAGMWCGGESTGEGERKEWKWGFGLGPNFQRNSDI